VSFSVAWSFQGPKRVYYWSTAFMLVASGLYLTRYRAYYSSSLPQFLTVTWALPWRLCCWECAPLQPLSGGCFYSERESASAWYQYPRLGCCSVGFVDWIRSVFHGSSGDVSLALFCCHLMTILFTISSRAAFSCSKDLSHNLSVVKSTPWKWG